MKEREVCKNKKGKAAGLIVGYISNANIPVVVLLLLPMLLFPLSSTIRASYVIFITINGINYVDSQATIPVNSAFNGFCTTLIFSGCFLIRYDFTMKISLLKIDRTTDEQFCRAIYIIMINCSRKACMSA